MTPSLQGSKPSAYSSPIDWLQTLGAVSSVTPGSRAPTAAGAGMGDIFGMQPEESTAQFDTSYDKATGGYAPFEGDHSKIDQLQSLYGTVGDSYDVTDTLTSLGATRKNNLLGGEQAANNAAQKYQESNTPGAMNGVGSSMLRAQALLPFLQADTQAAGEAGKYADSAKQQALGAAADIATKLAQLEADYTSSLATYNTNKANFGLNYAGAQTGNALKASQQNASNSLGWQTSQAQIAENARQANLQAALQTQQMNFQREQATHQEQRQDAATDAAAKPPSGNWVTNNAGQVVEGQAAYQAYQDYLNRGKSRTTVY